MSIYSCLLHARLGDLIQVQDFSTYEIYTSEVVEYRRLERIPYRPTGLYPVIYGRVYRADVIALPTNFNKMFKIIKKKR